MDQGWSQSAAAWIAGTGDEGDFGRKHVLDQPMLARATGRGFRDVLDVGCGEGRFCRKLSAAGLSTIGIDPTAELIDHARKLDPSGDYRIARAESLDFPDNSFDLVVSYLTLIDIQDAKAAIAEMTRVLRPSGTLLVANLASYATAGKRLDDGRMAVDDYLVERGEFVEMSGIRVLNWHRPMSYYMTAFLDNGLILRHFDEPPPTGGPPAKADRYRRTPYFYIMEWQVPA